MTDVRRRGISIIPYLSTATLLKIAVNIATLLKHFLSAFIVSPVYLLLFFNSMNYVMYKM